MEVENSENKKINEMKNDAYQNLNLNENSNEEFKNDISKNIEESKEVTEVKEVIEEKKEKPRLIDVIKRKRAERKEQSIIYRQRVQQDISNDQINSNPAKVNMSNINEPSKKSSKKVANDNVSNKIFILLSLKPFYFECQVLLHKKQYRKIFDEIENRESLLINTPFFLDFLIIKIKAIIKILNKKLKKYNPSKIHSFNSWNTRLENHIRYFRYIIEEPSKLGTTDFSDTFKEHKNSKFRFVKTMNDCEEIKNDIFLVQYYENDIQFTIQNLLILFEFNKKENLIWEAITFLSMAHRIVNYLFNNITQSKSFFVFEEVLHLVSKVLISDSDYKNAIIINNKCLELCERHLFLLIDIKEGLERNIYKLQFIPTETMSIKELFYCFEKLTVNIVSSLLHLGICLENLNLYKDSFFLLFSIKIFL